MSAQSGAQPRLHARPSPPLPGRAMRVGTGLSFGEVGEGSDHFCRCVGPASLCFLPGPSPPGEGRALPEPGSFSSAILDSSLNSLGAVAATLESRKGRSHVSGSCLCPQIRLVVLLRGSNSGATHMCKKEPCAGSPAFWEGRSFIYPSNLLWSRC